MGMRMFKNLNLTQDQQSKIQTIMQQYRAAHPQGSTPDPAARKAMRDQIDAVLTPQQQDQLKAEREKTREHRENGQNPPAPQPTATP
jgi:Spy/CpxP family protein refolding chaperone